MNSNLKYPLGLSFLYTFLLALLGVPRVIVHDLRFVGPESVTNTLLAVIPPVIWLGFVLWKKVKPFKPLLFIGIFYGILLGITHQILWNLAFDTPPILGGNLSELPPLANAFITRSFGFISSVVTGTVLGLIIGLMGSLINLFLKNKPLY